MYPQTPPKLKTSEGQSKKGQIVVEYILLLSVGVIVAMIMITMLVSRNQDNPGMFIVKWDEIIRMIGNDYADDLKPEKDEP